MKKAVSLFLIFALMFALTACSAASGTAVVVPAYPKAVSFYDYESVRKRVTGNAIDASFAESMQKFACDSSSILLKSKTENINYSPLSLYMALSLAATGADGKTKQEMFSVLGIGSADYASQQIGNLYRLLYTDNEIGKLKIANSLWLDKNSSFDGGFIKNAADNFYASLYNVNFADGSTGKLMGKWVADSTGGTLAPKITTRDDQLLAIMNAVYFKDQWSDRFNENYTHEDVFHLSSGGETKCDFMNAVYEMRSYSVGDGFVSASLYFKNSCKMTFILPDRGKSVEELLDTPEKVAAVLHPSRDEYGKVVFKIPKFSFGNEFELTDMLKSLGVNSAFEASADFSGITDGTAFISSVIQQTHIAIDENGAEAAAFTEIIAPGAMPPNNNIAELILDRPFIYCIASPDGAPLFIGVVNDPSKS